MDDRIAGDVPATGIVSGHARLTTAKGVVLDTDLQFWSAGAGRPNSSFLLPAYDDAVDAATSHVRVNEFLQLVGHTNAFAVGDVALLPKGEQRLGYLAGLQGEVSVCLLLAATSTPAGVTPASAP